MISIQDKLKEKGLYAEKVYNKLSIRVMRSDDNSVAFTIDGVELIDLMSKDDKPQLVSDLLDSKIEEYEERLKKGL